jgi:hypothetical protein
MWRSDHNTVPSGGFRRVYRKSVGARLPGDAANQQFGVGNVTTNLNVISPKWLQASVAVNGQGQAVGVAINTVFFLLRDTGTVVGGPVRGSSRTLTFLRGSLGLATIADGNNNNLFGGN